MLRTHCLLENKASTNPVWYILASIDYPVNLSILYWVNELLPPANEVCEGYVFTPVCQSFCSWGGVPEQVHPLGRYTPRAGTPPWPGTPTPWPGTHPGQVHPSPGRYTPLPGQVHTPQPGTHPQGRYTPPSPRQVHTSQAGTPSPRSSACWEIRATSGRYASHWNAFLFIEEKHVIFYEESMQHVGCLFVHIILKRI